MCPYTTNSQISSQQNLLAEFLVVLTSLSIQQTSQTFSCFSKASKSLGLSLFPNIIFFRTCYRSYCCLSSKAYNILLELPLPLLLLYPLRRVRVCETDVLAGPEAVSTTTSSSILIVVAVIIISIISSSFYPLNFLSLIFPSYTHIQHNFMLTIITTTTTTTLTAPHY